VASLLLRMVMGGIFVSSFALLADVLKPKSFAGLFGAAPSVALATLMLTIHAEGVSYAAEEARSMTGGAIAFGVYAYTVCLALSRWPRHPWLVVSALLPVWGAVAAWLWSVWLR
jgi:hypothetical protein